MRKRKNMTPHQRMIHKYSRVQLEDYLSDLKHRLQHAGETTLPIFTQRIDDVVKRLKEL